MIVIIVLRQLYQQQERELAKLAQKQKTYKMLEADDEDEDEDKVPVASLPKKEKTGSKKFRKRSDAQEDTDDEAGILYSYIAFVVVFYHETLHQFFLY